MLKELPGPESDYSESKEAQRKRRIEACIEARDIEREDCAEFSRRLDALFEESQGILHGPVSEESQTRLDDVDREIDNIHTLLAESATTQKTLASLASRLWRQG